MIISIFQLITLVFVALIIGLFIAWRLREERIKRLEDMLHNYQKKMLQMEMDYGNLEAFTKDLKEIKKEKVHRKEAVKSKPLKERKRLSS